MDSEMNTVDVNQTDDGRAIDGEPSQFCSMCKVNRRLDQYVGSNPTFNYKSCLICRNKEKNKRGNKKNIREKVLCKECNILVSCPSTHYLSRKHMLNVIRNENGEEVANKYYESIQQLKKQTALENQRKFFNIILSK